jgi:biotin carboxyl carrier protein
MGDSEQIELRLDRAADGLRLLAPDVGYYTRAVDEGRVLVPGDVAGWLLTLGRARVLTVPAGVTGVVRSRRPERVHHPVGHGDVLVELAPLEEAGAELAHDLAEAAAEQAGSLVFRASTAGRFWHRPAPTEPPLVSVGDEVEEGTAIGLVEVMKTFAQVLYRPSGGLPARARVVRVTAEDGADVNEGDALLELEPA